VGVEVGFIIHRASFIFWIRLGKGLRSAGYLGQARNKMYPTLALAKVESIAHI
jgi:hypothetical protein